MAFTRPTKYPRWAILDDGAATDNNTVGTTYGQPNVGSDPASLKLDEGFGETEQPPRQDFNWLHRQIAKWVYWLDQQEQDHGSRISTVEPLTTDAAKNDLKIEDIESKAGLTPDIDNANQLFLAVSKLMPLLNVSGFPHLVTDKNITVAAGSAMSASLDLTIRAPSIVSRGKIVVNAGATNWEPYVAGHANGGVPAGVTTFGNGVTLFIFAICDDLGQNFDIGLDSSAVATNLLSASGLTQYRMIGCVLTFDNGGTTELIQGYFDNTTGYFRYAQRFQDGASISVTTGTPTTVPLTVPDGPINLIGNVRAIGTHGSAAFTQEAWGSGDTIAAASIVQGNNGDLINYDVRALTAGSPSLKIQETQAGSASSVDVYTYGFWMNRDI